MRVIGQYMHRNAALEKQHSYSTFQLDNNTWHSMCQSHKHQFTNCVGSNLNWSLKQIWDLLEFTNCTLTRVATTSYSIVLQ